MTTIFYYCDRCKRAILTGEEMYSLTLSRDYINNAIVVQPLEANMVQGWCTACGPEAVAKAVASYNVSPR